MIYNLAIIGEAANHLSDAIKEAAPEIEWHKITGLRNIIIHEYFGISLPVVWDVVQNKLDSLENTCDKLLNNKSLFADDE